MARLEPRSLSPSELPFTEKSTPEKALVLDIETIRSRNPRLEQRQCDEAAPVERQFLDLPGIDHFAE
jgi:hypothetical protein